MRTVALDLGVRKISYSEAKNGQIERRATVRSFRELMSLLGPNTSKAQVAIEACREAWAAHAKLVSWGHEPVLVDTTRVKQIGVGQHGRKADRIDADVLALALERGQIPRAHVLSPERQQLRHQLAVRKMLVEAQAQTVTTIRGIVRAHGERLPTCDSEHFVERVAETRMSEALRELIAPAVAILRELRAQLRVSDSKVLQICEGEPAIRQLCTAPGVGVIVAAAFVSVIDDARRFDHAHKVQAYLGLVPSERSTGGRQRLGAITKMGNAYLRALLVQAAATMLRVRRTNDDPLMQWVRMVAERRGKRIAMVALARRLAGVLWAMWRRGTVYEAARVGAASAKGMGDHAQATAVRAAGLARAAKKFAVRARFARTTGPNAMKGANASM
jgi:transposase